MYLLFTGRIRLISCMLYADIWSRGNFDKANLLWISDHIIVFELFMGVSFNTCAVLFISITHATEMCKWHCLFRFLSKFLWLFFLFVAFYHQFITIQDNTTQFRLIIQSTNSSALFIVLWLTGWDVGRPRLYQHSKRTYDEPIRQWILSRMTYNLLQLTHHVS
jgi:hypothetical protein